MLKALASKRQNITTKLLLKSNLVKTLFPTKAIAELVQRQVSDQKVTDPGSILELAMHHFIFGISGT